MNSLPEEVIEKMCEAYDSHLFGNQPEAMQAALNALDAAGYVIRKKEESNG